VDFGLSLFLSRQRVGVPRFRVYGRPAATRNSEPGARSEKTNNGNGLERGDRRGRIGRETANGNNGGLTQSRKNVKVGPETATAGASSPDRKVGVKPRSRHSSGDSLFPCARRFSRRFSKCVNLAPAAPRPAIWPPPHATPQSPPPPPRNGSPGPPSQGQNGGGVVAAFRVLSGVLRGGFWGTAQPPPEGAERGRVWQGRQSGGGDKEKTPFEAKKALGGLTLPTT